MPKCPFCNSSLEGKVTDKEGWLCECGEWIPAGFEIVDEENCENCPVLHCLQSKKGQGQVQNPPLLKVSL